MNVIGKGPINSYMMPANAYAKKTASQQVSSNVPSGRQVSEIRRAISSAAQNKQNETRAVYGVCGTESILSKMKSYSDSLNTRRTQSKDTALKIKKLKYRYKDISSKIIRSKTSSAARNVASQAKREVLRLKRAKQNGDYDDSEEIDAAIAHAKAMESVAKKKVRHLMEEEMAKATAGPCMGELEENKDTKKKLDEESNPENSEDVEEGYEYDDYEAYESEYLEMINEYQDMDIAESEDFIANMEDLTSQLLDDFEEGMREMLEDMGFGEMSDSISAAEKDMDPADLDMMKIKHRNKEMKEIVKADAEYLKVVFDYIQKAKSGGASPSSVGQTSMNSVPAMVTQVAPIPMENAPSPVIDLAL